ncbi:MAG: peroxiredoxin [Ignavibacteria bacterium]|nr:peroxiredoxin [Ignavibacteria bacterium]NNJ53917.1 peroxiredoxin [Ignavibacteriaceae bacterium]
MAHLIEKEAPSFTAPAVLGNNKIDNDFTTSNFENKYVVLFFYPLDFTFVCPTEILAFNDKLEEFKNRNTEVIGISIDSVFTHLAWKKTPIEDGGIGQINYPLVSDLKREIGRAYDVLLEDETALRALFIIDKDGIVRHATLNDTSLGRNINEVIRTLDAIQHYDEHGKVCPANWEKGLESMNPTNDGLVDYLSKFAK